MATHTHTIRVLGCVFCGLMLLCVYSLLWMNTVLYICVYGGEVEMTELCGHLTIQLTDCIFLDDYRHLQQILNNVPNSLFRLFHFLVPKIFSISAETHKVLELI